MNDLFRFKGETRPIHDTQGRALGGYVKGEVYMLELVGRGMHMPVTIDAPISITYLDWNKFLEEWERV